MGGSTSSLLWYVARGSGIVAFILLSFSVMLGIAMNRRWYSANWPRMVVDAMHRWFTITFFTFTAIHVTTIMLDPFSHVSLMNAIIPFSGGYRPFWMSLGVIAIELGLAIGASAWIRRFIGYRAWHIMHGLAYPIYALSLFHALGTGTDTGTPWTNMVYGGSVVMIVLAVTWRLSPAPKLRAAVGTGSGPGPTGPDRPANARPWLDRLTMNETYPWAWPARL